MSLRKAVVCGIDRYPPPNALPSCVNDARAIAAFLSERHTGAEVHVVTDGDVTVARIERELTWMASDLRPEDRVIFYYSGHGFTKLVAGVMREFLVLLDESGKPALWEDDRLVEKTLPLGPDQCTCCIDACHSGGMFKWIPDPDTLAAEATLIKVYTPPAEEQQKAFDELTPVDGAKRVPVTGYRGFGRGPRSVVSAGALGGGTATGWASASPAAAKAIDLSEEGEPELNGLLISACLETETAAASTSQTGGRSAFTFALLKVLDNGPKGRTAQEIFDDAARILADLKFRQTPTCVARDGVALANRPFITMEAPAMNTSDSITTTAPAAPAPAPAAADEAATQKQLLLTLATLVEELVARHKAIELDDDGDDGNGDTEPDFIDAAGLDGDGEADQKFIPLAALGTILGPPMFDFVKNQLTKKDPPREATRIVRPPFRHGPRERAHAQKGFSLRGLGKLVNRVGRPLGGNIVTVAESIVPIARAIASR